MQPLSESRFATNPTRAPASPTSAPRAPSAHLAHGENDRSDPFDRAIPGSSATRIPAPFPHAGAGYGPRFHGPGDRHSDPRRAGGEARGSEPRSPDADALSLRRLRSGRRAEH